MTLKEAIINYINAKAEAAKPCQHEWELLATFEGSARFNPNFTWNTWTYFCKKCGENKTFNNRNGQK